MTYYSRFLFLFCGFMGYSCVNARKTAEGIVGGDEAEIGQIKYQISLETPSDNICGGGIIDDKFILTAAHCVIDITNGQFNKIPLTVLAASTKARVEDDPNVVRREVDKIFVNRVYNPVNPNPKLNYRTVGDFAVLRLKDGLGIDKNPLLSKLELPQKKDGSYSNYADEIAVVAGYGANWIHVHHNNVTNKDIEYGAGSYDKLRFAQAKVIGNEKCVENLEKPIQSTHICAAVVQRDPDHGEGVCSGDSGGPLVINNTTVIGVVSYSPTGCTESKSAAVYTRISSYVDFIENSMKDIYSLDMRSAVITERINPITNNIIKEFVEDDYLRLL